MTVTLISEYIYIYIYPNLNDDLLDLTRPNLNLCLADMGGLLDYVGSLHHQRLCRLSVRVVCRHLSKSQIINRYSNTLQNKAKNMYTTRKNFQNFIYTLARALRVLLQSTPRVWVGFLATLSPVRPVKALAAVTPAILSCNGRIGGNSVDIQETKYYRSRNQKTRTSVSMFYTCTL